MAQYKVPQDVEADDKLLGPFTFRQLIYLFITGGLIALLVFLFQIFPLLAMIPLPFIFFFAVLALPLKKDQPMETYLAAIVSFHLKPNKRLWNPGQRESTILITAPKIIEKIRTKNISQEEASHRLSFLANIADSEGYAINDSSLSDTYVAEAQSAPDIFDSIQSNKINETLTQETTTRHDEAVNQMRSAIEQAEGVSSAPPEIHKYGDHYQYQPEEKSADLPQASNQNIEQTSSSSVIVQPTIPEEKPEREPLNTVDNKPPAPPESPTDFIKTDNEEPKQEEKSEEPPEPKPEFIELANNPDFTVATISKEAERVKNKKDDEVYISLH